MPGSSDCLDPEEPKEVAKTRTLPASAVVLPLSQEPVAGRVLYVSKIIWVSFSVDTILTHRIKAGKLLLWSGY